MKATNQKIYGNGLLHSFPNGDEVSKWFLFGTRRRVDLDESKCCCSSILLINIVYRIKQHRI